MVKPQCLYKGQGDKRPRHGETEQGQDRFDDCGHGLVSFAVVMVVAASALGAWLGDGRVW
jgi:hypothetical protein